MQSEGSWRALLARCPQSPPAIAARLRLAQLHLRRGEVEVALGLLGELQGLMAARDARAQMGSTTQTAAHSLLGVVQPESGLGFDPDPFWREAQRWYELIVANQDDPKYGTAPLQELACLDQNRPSYRAQLERVARQYPDALLHDNLLVLWAENAPDRDERAAWLAACLRDYADGDAAAQALFRLADLEMQARGDDQQALRRAGVARMAEVANRFADRRWGQEAVERLRSIRQPAEGPGEAERP